MFDFEEFKKEDTLRGRPESSPSRISEVQPIKESRNLTVRTKEQLRGLVEGPLLSACEELYDKNIRTLSTSANQENIRNGNAHIVIDFDSLSDENKKVGRQLGKVYEADSMNQLAIYISMDENSTFEEIKTLAESIAHKFKKQEMTWAPSYTLEQARQMHGIDPDDQKYGVEEFTGPGMFYYDKDKKLFYLSEEHARKVRDREDA